MCVDFGVAAKARKVVKCENGVVDTGCKCGDETELASTGDNCLVLGDVTILIRGC